MGIETSNIISICAAVRMTDMAMAEKNDNGELHHQQLELS